MNAPEMSPHDSIDWSVFSAIAYRGDSPPVRFIVAGRWPVGEAGVLAGESGISKSMRSLQEAEEVGSRGGISLIINTEDSRPNVDRRLKNIRAHMKDGHKPCGMSLYIATQGLDVDCRLMAFDQFTLVVTTLPMFDWLRRILLAWAAEGHTPLVFLDNFTTLFSIDPNKAEHAGPVMAKLNALASETKSCIVVIHHMTKGSGTDYRSRIRGSGGIVDASRFAYVMHATDEDTAKHLKVTLKLPATAELVSVEPVKMNGPLKRSSIHYWRKEDGYLQELEHVVFISEADALIQVIREAAARGISYTKAGKDTGLFACRNEGWPGSLGKLSRNKLQGLASMLLEGGRLVVDAVGHLAVGAVT